MSLRIIASVEARMGSTRLPGKVLSEINGEPAILQLVKRLQKCKKLDGIVIATSTNPKDDALEKLAQSENISYHRGSEDDVLLRVVEAHQKMKSDIVVEICGDMPLIDPEIIDLGIETFVNNNCDILTSSSVQSFPKGMEVQVFPLRLLEQVEKKSNDLQVREHVSLYFYQNPEKYRIINLIAPLQWRRPDLRLVLDYQEDLELIRQIYRLLAPVHGLDFGINEIVELLNSEPALIDINSGVAELDQ